ncbi:MAG: hypothetical protein QGG50_00485 [Methanopyri archaeon]|nr:hypothetical protein [Methanopyri archaeon]
MKFLDEKLTVPSQVILLSSALAILRTMCVEKFLTVQKVIDSTGVSRMALHTTFKKLEDVGLIGSESIGKSKLFLPMDGVKERVVVLVGLIGDLDLLATGKKPRYEIPQLITI